MPSIVPICPADTPEDLTAIAGLFAAYGTSLPIDLGYQGFSDELASLPGRYAPPSGALFLARDAAGAPIGCIALRAMDQPGYCEMKRLYVAPAGRGLGLGRQLTDRLIGEARRLGYTDMWLDTLPTMTAALAVYAQAGFERVDAYYDTPIRETVFLRLRLA